MAVTEANVSILKSIRIDSLWPEGNPIIILDFLKKTKLVLNEDLFQFGSLKYSSLV